MSEKTMGAAVRGRGAISNRSGRYERFQHEAFDDGWGSGEEDRDRPVRTSVTPDRSRTIIARNDSPDVPFDLSINPYRGCEHGCIYCFARTTHAYLGLSPGLDFETRIFSKPEAAELLRRELSKPGYRCQTLALGANTDPYQPVEKEHRITRSILELLSERDHPVSIVTKSNLVLRDADLLVPMAERRLASVFVSVTTLDRELARKMEPRAPTPAKRLEAIEALSRLGVPVGVLASPMIPAVNDSELERILEAAAAAGAGAAGYIMVRLPLELKELVTEWLEEHFPSRAQHVLHLIRDTRAGKLYRSGFGERMRGTGPYAALLAERFRVAAARLGLDGALAPLDVSRFRPPRPELPGGQLSLF